MDIGSITGLSTTSDSSSTAGTTELGRDDFLKLLLQQLQMQDPLDPLKNDELIAQLAQFSSLEQMASMNQSLQDSLDSDLLVGQLLNNTMATTLIGRSVRVGTANFHVDGGSSASLGYKLGTNASAVVASVFDADGALVATVSGLDGDSGDHTFEWDGCDTNGNAVAAGKYSFEIAATAADGTAVQAEKFRVGRVDAVRYIDGNAYLVVGSSESLMSEVEEVFDES